MVSSFDLRHGSDVVDDPQGDTIPGALFDELFAQPEEHLKNPGRRADRQSRPSRHWLRPRSTCRDLVSASPTGFVRVRRIDHHMPGLRPCETRDDADRRVLMALRVRVLRRYCGPSRGTAACFAPTTSTSAHPSKGERLERAPTLSVDQRAYFAADASAVELIVTPRLASSSTTVRADTLPSPARRCVATASVSSAARSFCACSVAGSWDA